MSYVNKKLLESKTLNVLQFKMSAEKCIIRYIYCSSADIMPNDRVGGNYLLFRYKSFFGRGTKGS